MTNESKECSVSTLRNHVLKSTLRDVTKGTSNFTRLLATPCALQAHPVAIRDLRDEAHNGWRLKRTYPR